jgi:hypothetical protein
LGQAGEACFFRQETVLSMGSQRQSGSSLQGANCSFDRRSQPRLLRLLRRIKLLGTILIIILILALLGALPAWPHARAWGYGPSGVLGTLLVVVLILALLGRV